MRGDINGKFAGLWNYAHWLFIFNNICLSMGSGEKWTLWRCKNTSHWHSKGLGIRISLKEKRSYTVWDRPFLFCGTEGNHSLSSLLPFLFFSPLGGRRACSARQESTVPVENHFPLSQGPFSPIGLVLVQIKQCCWGKMFWACPLTCPSLVHLWRRGNWFWTVDICC